MLNWNVAIKEVIECMRKRHSALQYYYWRKLGIYSYEFREMLVRKSLSVCMMKLSCSLIGRGTLRNIHGAVSCPEYRTRIMRCTYLRFHFPVSGYCVYSIIDGTDSVEHLIWSKWGIIIKSALLSCKMYVNRARSGRAAHTEHITIKFIHVISGFNDAYYNYGSSSCMYTVALIYCVCFKFLEIALIYLAKRKFQIRLFCVWITLIMRHILVRHYGRAVPLYW